MATTDSVVKAKINQQDIQKGIKEEFKTLREQIFLSYQSLAAQAFENATTSQTLAEIINCCLNHNDKHLTPIIQFLEWCLRKASERGDIENVTQLLDAKKSKHVNLNVNASGPSKETALYYAVKRGLVAVVEVLLQNGANAGCQTISIDSKINTPYKLAVNNALLGQKNGQNISKMLSEYLFNTDSLSTSLTTFTFPTSFKNKQFDRYLNDLSKYLSQLASDLKNTQQDFGQFAVTCCLKYSDLSSREKIQKKVSAFDCHRQIVSDFLIAVSLGIEVGKDFSDKMKSILLVYIIPEVIRFKRTFPKSLQDSQDNFLKFLDEKSKNHRLEKERKQYLELKEKFSELAVSAADEILGVINRSIRHIVVDPAALVQFFEKYFPGNEIDVLCGLSKIPEILNEPQSETEKKDMNEKVSLRCLRVFSNSQTMLARYRQDIRDQLKVLIKTRKTDIMAAFYISKNGIKTISIPEFELELQDLLKVWEAASDFEEFIKIENDPNEVVLSLSCIIRLFSRGQLMTRGFEEVLPKMLGEVGQGFQTAALKMQQFMLEDQNKRNQVVLPDFEEVLKAERVYRKEQEAKIRVERQLREAREKQQRQETKLEADRDESKKNEDVETLNKLLDKLFFPKKDKDSLQKVERILSGNTDMTRQDFFALVTKLALTGFEDIKNDGIHSEDNKANFALGKDRIGFHTRHGRADAKMVEPAALKKFRTILEKLGLNKENFEVKLKEYIDLKNQDTLSNAGTNTVSNAVVHTSNQNACATVKAEVKKENPKSSLVFSDEAKLNVGGNKAAPTSFLAAPKKSKGKHRKKKK